MALNEALSTSSRTQDAERDVSLGLCLDLKILMSRAGLAGLFDDLGPGRTQDLYEALWNVHLIPSLDVTGDPPDVLDEMAILYARVGDRLREIETRQRHGFGLTSALQGLGEGMAFAIVLEIEDWQARARLSGAPSP